MKTLFRAFFTQLFTSETVTSDVQLRQSIVWVLAFILTPCLILLLNVFPQFQYLTIRVGRVHPPPGVIVRATAVRNLMAEDMLEWAVAILVGYSAVTVGLVTAFVWDALSFDRRDAMVLGPLPLRESTIVLAKLGALAAFLLGLSVGVNVLNSAIFALETSDQLGFGALLGHFAGSLVVTTMAATLVFSTIVTVRAVLTVFGGARVTAFVGTTLQFAFVFALFWFCIALVGSPARIGRFSVPDLGSRETPLSWFVAWFEVIRRSERGSWNEVIAMSRRVTLLVPLSIVAAVSSSALAFRRQLRLALAPSSLPGPLGHARISRFLARLLCGPDRLARAVSDFLLTTIVRNRVQQAPIAINVAIGLAMVLFALARQRGGASSTFLAAPLILAFWAMVGLRASFFVPSELPAAWTFQANAPERFRSYRSGIRAVMIASVAPAATILGAAAGGWRHGFQVLLLIVALADAIVLTIDFLPFTRPYRPGHARLKSRWPIYLVGAYVFGYAFSNAPIWSVAVAIVGLEAAGHYAMPRWKLQPKDEDADDTPSVIAMDLNGAMHGAILLATLFPATASAQVVTSQYDNARTGATLIETTLTPSNVNVNRFGKLFSFAVDGDVYAQPLYVPGVDIPGKGRHNVIFVATEHDSVYAFDAGNQPADSLWHVSLLTRNATTVSSADAKCPFIKPEIGITPTPVIDRATGTLYVVARTREPTGRLLGARYVQRLHALAITTGAEKFGGPVEIAAPGFDPLRELPRAALLLASGQVFIAWGSSCDVGPYSGWVMAYDAPTLKQTSTLNVAPVAGESGIWQSDMGPAADAEGHVYVVTGNGKYTVHAGGQDYGDSVLKLRLSQGRLGVVDHFTPSNEARLNERDLDLGASGPLLLPDLPGDHPRLLILGGKEARLQVLDRDRLKDQPLQAVATKGGTYSTPAYWNGHVFVLSSNDSVRDYRVDGRHLTGVAVSARTFLNPGAAPAISSNGTRDGIVWAVATKVWNDFNSTTSSVLHAFDATNVARELYSSDEKAARDRAGIALRFAVPTVANGRVYIGTTKEVDVYGLLPPNVR